MSKLDNLSVKQLCLYYNFILQREYDLNYDLVHCAKTTEIKQQLIDMGACSNYVLEYRGKL